MSYANENHFYNVTNWYHTLTSPMQTLQLAPNSLSFSNGTGGSTSFNATNLQMQSGVNIDRMTPNFLLLQNTATNQTCTVSATNVQTADNAGNISTLAASNLQIINSPSHITNSISYNSIQFQDTSVSVPL